MSIVKGTEFNAERVSFSEPKADSNGKKLVFVNYNGSKFRIQTPRLRAPLGMSKWENEKGDTFEISLDLEKDSAFHRNMLALDALITREIKSKSKEWVGGKVKVNDDYITNTYKPIVKPPYDKEGNLLEQYSDRIKLKVMTDKEYTKFVSEKKYNTELGFYDSDKNRIEATPDNYHLVCPKGSHLVGLAELAYISIGSLGISPVFRLVQAKVEQNKTVLTEFSMLDLEDDTETTEATPETVTGDVIEEAEEPESESESEDPSTTKTWADSVETETLPEPAASKTKRRVVKVGK
jgi:hypothetical protein